MKGVIVSLRSGGYVRCEWNLQADRLNDVDRQFMDDLLAPVSDYRARFPDAVIGHSELPAEVRP